MGFVNVSHGNTDYGGNIVNNLNLHQEGMFKKVSGAKQNSLYLHKRQLQDLLQSTKCRNGE